MTTIDEKDQETAENNEVFAGVRGILYGLGLGGLSWGVIIYLLWLY